MYTALKPIALLAAVTACLALWRFVWMLKVITTGWSRGVFPPFFPEKNGRNLFPSGATVQKKPTRTLLAQNGENTNYSQLPLAAFFFSLSRLVFLRIWRNAGVSSKLLNVILRYFRESLTCQQLNQTIFEWLDFQKSPRFFFLRKLISVIQLFIGRHLVMKKNGFIWN